MIQWLDFSYYNLSLTSKKEANKKRYLLIEPIDTSKEAEATPMETDSLKNELRALGFFKNGNSFGIFPTPKTVKSLSLLPNVKKVRVNKEKVGFDDPQASSNQSNDTQADVQEVKENANNLTNQVPPEIITLIKNNDPKELDDNQDTLDSFFQQRMVDVRNAMRDIGFDGKKFKPLSKDGIDACFKFKYIGSAHNVIGYYINDVADDLTLTPKEFANEINAITEYQGMASSLVFSLKETTYQRILNTLEENNLHSEFVLFKAKRTDNVNLISRAEEIVRKHYANGSITSELNKERQELEKEIYHFSFTKRLINHHIEEVFLLEIAKTISASSDKYEPEIEYTASDGHPSLKLGRTSIYEVTESSEYPRILFSDVDNINHKIDVTIGNKDYPLAFDGTKKGFKVSIKSAKDIILSTLKIEPVNTFKEAAREIHNLKHFVSNKQKQLIGKGIKSKNEKQYFNDLVVNLSNTVKAIPEENEQNDIAYLHYFNQKKKEHWYITGKEMNANEKISELPQNKAFGLVVNELTKTSELISISIEELIHNDDVDIDFDFTTKPLKDIKDFQKVEEKRFSMRPR